MPRKPHSGREKAPEMGRESVIDAAINLLQRTCQFIHQMQALNNSKSKNKGLIHLMQSASLLADKVGEMIKEERESEKLVIGRSLSCHDDEMYGKSDPVEYGHKLSAEVSTSEPYSNFDDSTLSTLVPGMQLSPILAARDNTTGDDAGSFRAPRPYIDPSPGLQPLEYKMFTRHHPVLARVPARDFTVIGPGRDLQIKPLMCKWAGGNVSSNQESPLDSLSHLPGPALKPVTMVEVADTRYRYIKEKKVWIRIQSQRHEELNDEQPKVQQPKMPHGWRVKKIRLSAKSLMT